MSPVTQVSLQGICEKLTSSSAINKDLRCWDRSMNFTMHTGAQEAKTDRTIQIINAMLNLLNVRILHCIIWQKTTVEHLLRLKFRQVNGACCLSGGFRGGREMWVRGFCCQVLQVFQDVAPRFTGGC